MEAIRNTLEELTVVFNTRMAEFQDELKGAIPATSPTSNINSQFHSFRAFVLTALKNIQLQVEVLSRQQDELEMRSRKKILLLHGVPEVDKEDTSACVSRLLSERFGISQVASNSFSRCHRMGHRTTDRPRVILIKFRDSNLKFQVWSSKPSLKGTGITVSEFLTKARHKTFVAARQRFGVAKCWTRDGIIVVLNADGSRHRITTLAELGAITSQPASAPVPFSAPVESVAVNKTKPISQKPKRIAKK